MPAKPINTPFVLIIRDGWGRNPHPEHDSFNAIKLAKTPVSDGLERDWPTVLIRTSGEAVGLTEGTMGNSEVGHQNIGAGRIVDQDAVRITKACREGQLGQIDALREPIERAAAAGKAVHLLCINSDAGVHGQLEHLYAVVRLCKELGAPRVYLHLFTDGRDTGPFMGKDFARQVENECAAIGAGRIVSVVGRYWAMDRDSRWERVRLAYDLLVGRGKDKPGVHATTDDAIGAYYDQPKTETMKGDEFVAPGAIGSDWKDTRIADGDTVIFVNYRGDRPRELCAAFLFDEFHGSEKLKPSPDSGEHGFDRGDGDRKLDLDFVIMTPYADWLVPLARVAFPRPPKMANISGAYFSGLGLTQFRCAETEKYPHVTFFYNDYREEPFKGEHRQIIQSPMVATYDMQPEMSAAGIQEAVLGRLASKKCESVIVVNFANTDMVGHTGDLEAAIVACETVDACVGRIVDATLARGGSLIVTADHGNAEQMWNPDANAPHTAHTTFDVPLIVVGEPWKGKVLRQGGTLGDILPTAIAMMGLEQPAEMTGKNLIVE